MLALEAGARRRGYGAGRAVRGLLARVRPPAVTDDTVAARVRETLARTAHDPEAITVAIEHGCVDLRGPVDTRERARIVKAIATVRGVDSVLDLMTEPSATHPPLLPGAYVPPQPRALGALTTSTASTTGPLAWQPAARVVAAGTGLGVAIAALRSGGVFAVPAAALGVLLVTGAAASIIPRGARSERHAPF
jgi:hypothetical protein